LDARCCDPLNDSLYNIKHSGFFDFEADENGLWLIYKRDLDKSESEAQEETYVIGKIDEKDFVHLKIEKKWLISVKAGAITNMFITCGRLYALIETHNAPLGIRLICDLYNDSGCKQIHLDDDDKQRSFGITIQSRQLTSLSYNPDKKLLYIVDGGSFVYYKIQVNEENN
jgi:hypothetical protein